MRTFSLLLLAIMIISLIALVSCGPNYYLKRAERNLKKAEQLGAKITPDTVYIERNIFIPEVSKDTIFQAIKGDTVFIHKDRLSIRYIKLQGDSVFIRGQCRDSIIKIKEPVYINKTITAECGLPWWVYVVFGLSALVITVLCFRR